MKLLLRKIKSEFDVLISLFKLRVELNVIDNELYSYTSKPLDEQEMKVIREYIHKHNSIVDRMRMK